MPEWDAATGDHILIVDDDPDTREILDLVLGTLEIPVHQAHDGREALNDILTKRPRLILLDLSMPGLDGQAVLEALRVSADTAALPVIVFTASPVTPELSDRLHVPPSRIIRKGNLSMTRLRDMALGILGHSAAQSVLDTESIRSEDL